MLRTGFELVFYVHCDVEYFVLYAVLDLRHKSSQNKQKLSNDNAVVGLV